MKESTEQLIRELAEKLGTTVEHLWGVLVKQAQISAITDSIFLLVSGAALALSLFFLVKTESDDENIIFPWAMATVFGGIFWTLKICFGINEIISGFYNPEFWALQQLIK